MPANRSTGCTGEVAPLCIIELALDLQVCPVATYMYITCICNICICTYTYYTCGGAASEWRVKCTSEHWQAQAGRGLPGVWQTQQMTKVSQHESGFLKSNLSPRSPESPRGLHRFFRARQDRSFCPANYQRQPPAEGPACPLPIAQPRVNGQSDSLYLPPLRDSHAAAVLFLTPPCHLLLRATEVRAHHDRA